jgi:WD40 repeat protein
LGVCIFLKINGHSPITDIDWSPDGESIVSSSINDHRIFIWTNDKGNWRYKTFLRYNGGIKVFLFKYLKKKKVKINLIFLKKR